MRPQQYVVKVCSWMQIFAATFLSRYTLLRPPGRGFGQGVSGPSVAAHLGISWRVWRRAWVCRVVAFVVLFCFGPLQACEQCERGKGWLMQTWQLGSTSSHWLPYNGTIPWCDDRVCLCWPHVTGRRGMSGGLGCVLVSTACAVCFRLFLC